MSFDQNYYKNYKRKFIDFNKFIYSNKAHKRFVKNLSETPIFFKNKFEFKKNLLKTIYKICFMQTFKILKSVTTNITQNYKLQKKLHYLFVSKKSCKRRKLAVFGKFKYIVKRRLRLKKSRSFHYAVHVSTPKKKSSKRSLHAQKHAYYKKLSIFYGFKRISSFYKVLQQSFSKSKLNVVDGAMYLETRIENLLHKTSLFPSIYFIKKLVFARKVFVNNRTVDYSFYNLKQGEILTIDKKYYAYAYSYLKFLLKTSRILLAPPEYLMVDHELMAMMLIRSPTFKTVNLPASFNMYTNSQTFHRY